MKKTIIKIKSIEKRIPVPRKPPKVEDDSKKYNRKKEIDKIRKNRNKT